MSPNRLQHGNALVLGSLCARSPSSATDLYMTDFCIYTVEARIVLIKHYSPSSIAIRSKKSSNGSLPAILPAFHDCKCSPVPFKPIAIRQVPPVTRSRRFATRHNGMSRLLREA